MFYKKIFLSSAIPKKIIFPAVVASGIGYYGLSSGGSTSDGSGDNEASPDIGVSDWKLVFLKSLPFRSISRFWGHVNTAYELPVFLRAPVYKTWSWLFDCNLAEMKAKNLVEFRNLNEFFTRELKANARPLADCDLISPADARILTFGRISENSVEQVKGLNYAVDALLGYGPHGLDEKELEHPLPFNDTENQLYHVVLYLAPGDYHRFHSPSNWIVEKIKHFTGQLLSVSPTVVRMVHGLFVLNERIVMTGKWAHGFFSMTAVGATNVGSIELSFDQSFKTNHHLEEANGTFSEKCLKTGTLKTKKPKNKNQHSGITDQLKTQEMTDGYWIYKGDHAGTFNLGSTIVLIFEAPKSFEFQVETGQKIKMGQPLGSILQPPGQIS